MPNRTARNLERRPERATQDHSLIPADLRELGDEQVDRMPRVTFINLDGTRTEIDVPVGQSLMQAAVSNGIESIVGDCGGVLACATCHVLVEEEFWQHMPPITPNEDQMLDFTAMERRPNSRLSCQLVMTEELDGLMVRIAAPQL